MEVSQFINDANFRRRIKNESAQREHEKKVVSDNPGFVDFGIGLVNSIPYWANEIMGGIQITEELRSIILKKIFLY